ncbi:MAG TPA: hypothetical protein VIV61_08065 [Candidatus Ozemobacteraceae bacterium]
MKKRLMLVALFVCVVALALCAHDGWVYRESLDRSTAEAQAKCLGQIDGAAKKLGELCELLASNTLPVVAAFGDGRIDEKELVERFREISSQDVRIGAIGLTLASGPITLEEHRESKLYCLRPGISASDSIGLIPLLRLPLPAGSRGIAGELLVEIERWRLKELLLSFSLGEYGFPFLMTREGRFLWHPHRDFMGMNNDIFAVARMRNLPAMAEFGTAMGREVKTWTAFRLDASRRMWLFGTPLPAFDLAVCGFVNETEILSKTDRERHRPLFRILVAVFTFLLAGVTVVFLRRPDTADHLWLASGVYTTILGIGIGVIWFVTKTTFPVHYPGGPPILEPSMISMKIEEYRLESKKFGYESPIYIPTGIFIKSIEFDGAINVKLTGYVWQKYPKAGYPGIDEGVTFPESVDATLEKAFERVENEERTVGWNFTLTLRQGFDYSNYPFDKQDIWMRLWHADFDRNVVLVPDLLAYSQVDPTERPGIDDAMVLPSWQIRRTFFNYVDYDYNTNFGMNRYSGQVNFPELHFHVLIDRNFLDPFMSSILPLFVVALQMFSVLIISTKHETFAERLGFNSGVVVQVAAALFFVVIYAQIDLRRRLEIEQIMYMDYYYFAMYIIFVAVSVNSILFAYLDGDGLIEYRDNILPKVVFWPAVFGAIFAVTAVYFYP